MVQTYSAKTDCNCYVPTGAMRCRALIEVMCISRGDCKFYKKKEAKHNDKSLSEQSKMDSRDVRQVQDEPNRLG